MEKGQQSQQSVPPPTPPKGQQSQQSVPPVTPSKQQVQHIPPPTKKDPPKQQKEHSPPPKIHKITYKEVEVPVVTYQEKEVPTTTFDEISVPVTTYETQEIKVTVYEEKRIPVTNFKTVSVPKVTYEDVKVPVVTYENQKVPKVTYNDVSIPDTTYETQNVPVTKTETVKVPKTTYQARKIPKTTYTTVSVPIVIYETKSMPTYEDVEIPPPSNHTKTPSKDNGQKTQDTVKIPPPSKGKGQQSQESVKHQDHQTPKPDQDPVKTTKGTILPNANFDAAADCEKLRNAMHGYGTNEKVIIEVLTSCSNKQRQALKTQYTKKFQRDLVSKLAGELSGDFEKLVLLMMDPAASSTGGVAGDVVEHFADELRNSMKGSGTKEAALNYVIVSRSEIDLADIKSKYETKFNRSLAKDIKTETSGNYEKLLLKLIAA